MPLTPFKPIKTLLVLSNKKLKCVTGKVILAQVVAYWSSSFKRWFLSISAASIIWNYACMHHHISYFLKVTKSKKNETLTKKREKIMKNTLRLFQSFPFVLSTSTKHVWVFSLMQRIRQKHFL